VVAGLSRSELWLLLGALAALLVGRTMFQLWLIKTSSPSRRQRWAGLVILAATVLLVAWAIVAFRD
jgi:uncharacterized membrane protein